MSTSPEERKWEPSRLLERRAHVRVRRRIHVKCRPEQGGAPVHSANTLEISSSGVRLEHRQEIAMGTSVQITFDDPNVNPSLVLHGVLTWTRFNQKKETYESGIEFADLSPVQRLGLLEVIGRELQDDLVEQRRVVRLRQRIPVHLRNARGWFGRKATAWTVDIGPGGMAVVSAKPFEIGSVCHVEIMVPSEKKPVGVSAEVLACQRQAQERWHLRLRFVDVTDAELRKIRHFLMAGLKRASL